MNDPDVLERSGRNARTLVQNTVQVLDGDMRFHAAGQDHRLAAGDLLVLDAGVEHDVVSDTGGTFLLTLLQLEQGQTRSREE